MSLTCRFAPVQSTCCDESMFTCNFSSPCHLYVLAVGAHSCANMFAKHDECYCSCVCAVRMHCTCVGRT